VPGPRGGNGNRAFYQAVFVSAVAVAGLFAILVFSWLARKQWKRNLLGLLGTVFLFVFVLIRASSIHHVDVALQWKLAGAKWNWILELGGIAVVLMGAAVASVQRMEPATSGKPSSRINGYRACRWGERPRPGGATTRCRAARYQGSKPSSLPSAAA